MSRVSKFINWMGNPTLVQQLIACCVMAMDKDDIVGAMEHASCKTTDLNTTVLLGNALHNAFDHFLANDKSTRSDDLTWYEHMEEEIAATNPGMAEEIAINGHYASH